MTTDRTEHREASASWDPEWENIHSTEDMGRYPSEHFIRFMVRHFGRGGNHAAIRVLEIGFGQGAQVWYLAREGFLVNGIEGSATAIDKARRYLAADGLEADLRLGDAASLPFDDASFDVVADIECLMGNDWDGTRRIVEEVRRVLKPGGLFFSQTFGTKTYVGASRRQVGENTYRDIGDGPLARRRLLRLIPEADLARMYAGFQELVYDRFELTNGGPEKITEEWLVTCRR